MYFFVIWLTLSKQALSGYFYYVKHPDIFFTIVMLMLICHNDDSYSSIKDH